MAYALTRQVLDAMLVKAQEPEHWRQKFCTPTCRANQHYVDNPAKGRVLVDGALRCVADHPLQEVRDQAALDKHTRDLNGLIRQAIIDTIKTRGECHADDLLDLYPVNEVDRCRELATRQFASLRSGKSPLISERERRASTIKARKRGKSGVYVFTRYGRETLVGPSSGSSGHVAPAVRSGEPTPGSAHPEAPSASSPPPVVEVAADPGSPASSTEDQLLETLCEEFDAEVVEESSEPQTLFGSVPSAYNVIEEAA